MANWPGYFDFDAAGRRILNIRNRIDKPHIYIDDKGYMRVTLWPGRKKGINVTTWREANAYAWRYNERNFEVRTANYRKKPQ